MSVITALVCGGEGGGDTFEEKNCPAVYFIVTASALWLYGSIVRIKYI